MQNKPSLYLIRGIPGSAKSTVAKNISNGIPESHWVEADAYFMHEGKYNFDASQLYQAHRWCQSQTKDFLEIGLSVIVSNTFTTLKELRPYFEIAKNCNIIPNVVLAQNQFKDVHNVPEGTIAAMKQRFVYDITPLFQEFYPSA